ncbi:MAG: guanylate kinase [Acidimicrobiaceae bacterium]|nr:guanylate kinase [Acidimicrobiaceae bacterium]|tara:strand:- start:1138 stop:1680 length:543 start_codon:yes stop_codon:yes gene_type:complete
MLIVVSGPGGVGKGTIAELLVERDKNLWLSKSWTTRSRRDGEDEDSYVFVTEKAFEKAIQDRAFLEWAEFHGNFYATPWPTPPEGKDVLLEIDVQGAQSVTKQGLDCLMVFVDTPTIEDQAQRLRGRGDSEEEVQRRIQEGERERSNASELGAIFVINDDLEKAVAEIQSIISLYRSRKL